MKLWLRWLWWWTVPAALAAMLMATLLLWPLSRSKIYIAGLGVPLPRDPENHWFDLDDPINTDGVRAAGILVVSADGVIECKLQYNRRREPGYIAGFPASMFIPQVQAGVSGSVEPFDSQSTVRWGSTRMTPNFPQDATWFAGPHRWDDYLGKGCSISLIAPHWAYAIVLLVVTATVGCRFVRVRRREGCCFKCGYDLRATPERCPECGTVSA